MPLRVWFLPFAGVFAVGYRASGPSIRLPHQEAAATKEAVPNGLGRSRSRELGHEEAARAPDRGSEPTARPEGEANGQLAGLRKGAGLIVEFGRRKGVVRGEGAGSWDGLRQVRGGHRGTSRAARSARHAGTRLARMRSSWGGPAGCSAPVRPVPRCLAPARRMVAILVQPPRRTWGFRGFRSSGQPLSPLSQVRATRNLFVRPVQPTGLAARLMEPMSFLYVGQRCPYGGRARNRLQPRSVPGSSNRDDLRI
jgi:hypothetical protein